MYCIETKGLSHKYPGHEIALQDINMQVPEGSIYGFLGPNGAGKTTTLRLLLGLLKKQQGEVGIFNKPFSQHRVEILKNIGSLIESPSLYGHLTAYENLKIFQRVYQCPVKRIDTVLEIVGLAGTGNKKAAKFSLGMKQRLGLAMALLHEPSLLILDEPTNGLDPNGIIEMRELLIRLNKEHGMTILVSSHLLAEIEKLVTHIGIISKGSIVFQGTLQGLHVRQEQGSVIKFGTSDPGRTAGILASSGLKPQVNEAFVSVGAIDEKLVANLNRQLVENRIEVFSITSVKNDLESIFMDLTK